MNIDKLTEAIQIIVREEIRKVLPRILKKTIQLEVKRKLDEHLAELNQSNFMDDTSLSTNESNIYPRRVNRNPKKLSNNPVFNEILNETAPFDKQHRIGDDDFRTLAFDSKDVHTLGAGSIAERFGYGDIVGKPQEGGLGVTTGNKVLDKVFNRNYSDLVKAMDKVKK